jgi:hypothetical protein
MTIKVINLSGLKNQSFLPGFEYTLSSMNQIFVFTLLTLNGDSAIYTTIFQLGQNYFVNFNLQQVLSLELQSFDLGEFFNRYLFS